jgi:hypothetical protein
VGRKKKGCGKFPSTENQNEDLADLGHGLGNLASLIAEKHLQRLGMPEKLQYPEKELKEDNC